MKISDILNYIDNGLMALPEFQRGYVWNRDQIRGLFDSLYKRHPVGGLLVWNTESKQASHRGDGQLAVDMVKLLLDGQQRITSLYGIVRSSPPKFFDGNPEIFKGLMFHLEKETFSFYQPVKMQDDSLWINVTQLMQNGNEGLGDLIAKFSQDPAFAQNISTYTSRLTKLLGIIEVDLYIEEITEKEKDIGVIVDIFNRVNSGGTKLSKGDLALAKICSVWPEARDEMKQELKRLENAGYQFTLDWLLRSVNTVLTGEAKFQYLHGKSAEDIQVGLKKATAHIDYCLNIISGRLGLDHDRVFFGRFAIPVMVRYLEQRKETLTQKEKDKLLFWFVQCGMWGRFSGSTESMIDKDLEALEDNELDSLLEQLRLWHGGLSVEADHFSGWSLGARFYPVLYLITRMGSAKDWGTGIELNANLLGKMNTLEVHHIFPKSQLYDWNYSKKEVNALANLCFLTKDTNLHIGNRLPQDYFQEIEQNNPGALASQWIPLDPELWKIENYRDFLEARKALLAEEVNKQMRELLHEDTWFLEGSAASVPTKVEIFGGIASKEEEEQLNSLNAWIVEQGLPQGQLAYDYSDPETGEQKAVFDLAWPYGIQEELSQPVAVLLNESSEILAVASQAGFKCFTDVENFKKYVKNDIMAIEEI